MAQHRPSEAPTWLVGDWSRWVRDPADLVRLSFIAGALVTLALGESEQALRLFLTFLVSLVPRLLAAPRPFDLAFGIGMSLQAWGNVAHAFSGQGYDKVVHFVLPCAVAMLSYIGLVRARVLPEFESERRIHRSAGIVVITFAIGFAVAGAYEMYEWFARHVFGAHLRVGYGDSIGDLADNAAGALLGGALLLLWDRRGWGTHQRVSGDEVHSKADVAAHQPDVLERLGSLLLARFFPHRPARPRGGEHGPSGAPAAARAPRLLAGDWTRLVRDPIDLVRASFIVGVVVSAALGRPELTVRFVVTFAVAIMVRVLDPPRPVDLAFCAAMGLQAWGAAAFAARGVPGYDALVHVVVSLAFAALLYLALVRARVMPEFADARGIHRRLAVFATAASLGYTIGIGYEIYVWVASHAFAASYHVNYDALIGRLALDLLGACAGGLFIVIWDVYGWGTRRRVPAAVLAKGSRAG